MKLKSVPALFGKTMKIHDDQEIKFDASGVCEVKDSLGKALLEKYPSMVFDESFEPELPKTKKQEFDNKYAETLGEEIDILTETVKARTNEVELAKADTDSWKEKVGELTKERDEAVGQLNREKVSTTAEIKGLKLKIELITSSITNLQKMCDLSGYPKDEWAGLVKDKLIEYLIGKS